MALGSENWGKKKTFENRNSQNLRGVSDRTCVLEWMQRRDEIQRWWANFRLVCELATQQQQHRSTFYQVWVYFRPDFFFFLVFLRSFNELCFSTSLHQWYSRPVLLLTQPKQQVTSILQNNPKVPTVIQVIFFLFFHLLVNGNIQCNFLFCLPSSSSPHF